MVLWIVFAVLTALAALAVLRPYLRQRTVSNAAPPRDLEIYKQQLREVEDERARGLLGESEAQAARIEISRRILALSEEKAAGDNAAAPATSTAAPYAMGGLLAVVTAGIYLIYGSPGLPGQPVAGRTAPTIEFAITQIEKHLSKNPEDAERWAVAGAYYLRVGRFKDAVDAHTRAMKITGETAERLANLGEALTFANKGIVPAEARGLFEKALKKDETGIKASFWLGMADEQAGKFAGAANRYRKLMAGDIPEEVKRALRERLAELEQRLAGGQQPQQQGAAADDALIERMVAKLAERLKADGSDLTGWLKLVKAYMVLERRDDALNAVKDARRNFSGNSEALGQIDALAKSLGLAS